jgi:putative SOS response-associated peptidase YedK
MCGRYSFTLPPEAIRQLFRVVTGLNLQPRYNIAPTQAVPVIGLEQTGERALKMFRWGLVPRWSPNAAEPKLQSLLAPYDPAKTDLFRVDARVNSVKNDDPECLKRLE